MAWPADWTSELLSGAKLNAWMAAIKTWGGVVDTAGYAMKIASAAPTDGDIPNGAFVPWIDTATNKLKFRVRYPDGTLKSGEVSLT